jgi:translation initiation factor IF-3
VRLFGHPARFGGVFVFRPDERTDPLSSFDRERRVRVNRQIRISPVRVVTAEGEQLGVLPVEEALAAAQERGLDLVEVAPMARPPVVKIMDYGKFKFE